MPYEPIPFVAPLSDQTPQRLKLADLLYQANMARSQAELQRQMQVAQMIAQFGQNIGAGIESWMDRQQKERLYNLQLERENRMMAAQEAQARAAARTLEFQKARELADVQREFFASMPEGVPVTGDIAEQTLRNLGPYGAQTRFTPALKSTPEMTDPSKFLMPEVTMETAPVGPEGGVAPTKQVSMAELAGVMAPERSVVREASLMKPMSIDTQKKMAEMAQTRDVNATRAALDSALQSGDKSQIEVLANRLTAIDPTFKSESYYAITGKTSPTSSPQTQMYNTAAMQLHGKRFDQLTFEEQVGIAKSMPKQEPQPVVITSGITGAPYLFNKQTGALQRIEGMDVENEPPRNRTPVLSSIIEREIGRLPSNQRLGLRNTYNGMDNQEVVQSFINDSKLLDDKQRDLIQKRMSALEKLRQLRNEVSRLGTGFSQSTIADILATFGKGDPTKEGMRASLNTLAEEVKLKFTGLASTGGEMNRYDKIVPLGKMNTDLNLERIDRLIRDTEIDQRSALSMIDRRLPNDPSARMYFGKIGRVGLSEMASGK